MLALVVTGRAGTKILQSFLDGHAGILMVPAYPLMYLYPHWDTWSETYGPDFSWERAIDLFCEKHASVLDSRKVPGLSGLERLGPEQDQHIEVDEGRFRAALAAMLDGLPVRRRTFLLAVHYAYAIAKGWDLESKTVLLYHIHDPTFLKGLVEDFPDLEVWTMLRETKASLASVLRGDGIVDGEKLNPTDSMRNVGRNFRIGTKLHFDALDRMGTYVSRDQVRAMSHEGLHRDLEGLVTAVCRKLGLEFSPSLLQSTFDGKLWWGDVTNKTPVNGPDPAATTPNRWKRTLGKLDGYVIEGVASDFYRTYGYERTSYRDDTALNKLLLVLAVLWPSRIEWRTAGFYLDPRTHIRFLQAAIGESAGRIARKDYTWNATYLYKRNYVDLKLWRSRWHERLLDYAARPSREGARRTAGPALIGLSRALYVGAQYARFWVALITYPAQVFRRWGIHYARLWRRLRGRTFLPALLE